MSEISIFNDWLKQLPLVTDLNATRFVLAFDSNGVAGKISTDSIALHRGQAITDCNAAMKIGQYLPSTNELLNAPPGFTVNTSDAIINIGGTSSWFRQFYFPYLQNASNAHKFAVRSYAANTKWGAWTVYTMPTT